VRLMTTGARRNPSRGAASSSREGVEALEKGYPRTERGGQPRRQSRPVDGGRKSRENERGRQTGRRRGTSERTEMERERERERESERGTAGEEETRSERPFASAVRCFRGIGRSSGERNRSPPGGSRGKGEGWRDRGEGTRAEADALFRAQYARRARSVRCRVRAAPSLRGD